MRSIASILLPVLLATALTAAEIRVRVLAEHTVLRYPVADSVEIACMVQTGQELTVRGPLEGNWVPVTPPDDVSVWIYSELVRKGRVIRDKVQVRSGPGANFKVVGSLNHDLPVELRGRVGDWLKIRPPSGFSLWISRAAIGEEPYSGSTPDLLPIPSTIATGLLSVLNSDTNDDTNATARLSDADNSTVEPPPPPPELLSLLTASPHQGCRFRGTGTLRPSVPGATSAPAHDRLTGVDRSGGSVTFCHLLDTQQLTTFLYGTKLTIEGSAWWLKGDSVPVVQVENVHVEK